MITLPKPQMEKICGHTVCVQTMSTVLTMYCSNICSRNYCDWCGREFDNALEPECVSDWRITNRIDFVSAVFCDPIQLNTHYWWNTFFLVLYDGRLNILSLSFLIYQIIIFIIFHTPFSSSYSHTDIRMC